MDGCIVCQFWCSDAILNSFFGKGGIILTDSLEAYNWLKLASYDGRDLTTPYTDKNHVKMLGYHMYMTPEDAARGIILMDSISRVNEDTGNDKTYVDVSLIFKDLYAS